MLGAQKLLRICCTPTVGWVFDTSMGAKSILDTDSRPREEGHVCSMRVLAAFPINGEEIQIPSCAT